MPNYIFPIAFQTGGQKAQFPLWITTQFHHFSSLVCVCVCELAVALCLKTQGYKNSTRGRFLATALSVT